MASVRFPTFYESPSLRRSSQALAEFRCRCRPRSYWRRFGCDVPPLDILPYYAIMNTGKEFAQTEPNRGGGSRHFGSGSEWRNCLGMLAQLQSTSIPSARLESGPDAPATSFGRATSKMSLRISNADTKADEVIARNQGQSSPIKVDQGRSR